MGTELECFCTMGNAPHMVLHASLSKLPDHLVLQTDNTVALSKNSASHVFSTLVARRSFATVTCNYLQKKHTHEDVDKFMGELLPIMRRSVWETPGGLLEVSGKGLRPRATHVREKVLLKKLEAIRNWEHWVEPIGVTLYNTFKNHGQKSTAHSKIYGSQFRLQEVCRLDLCGAKQSPGKRQTAS